MQTLDQIDAEHPSSSSQEALYPNEVRRWLLLVGLPMLAACICVALSFRIRWFYAGAIAFGPGLGILAIIYLAISSDTNGAAAPASAAAEPASVRHELEPARAAA